MTAAAAVGRTLDVGCGALHRDGVSAKLVNAVAGVNIVERALRLLAQTELDYGLAQTVHAAAEAYGLVLVGETAVDTAGDVHKRRVEEVHGLFFQEVVGAAVEREGAQKVTFLVGLNLVLADGHANLVLAVGVAHHGAILRLNNVAVNLKLN